MKLICNIFLILYLVCKPAFPLAEYVVNYNQIQVLCVNKARPELNCNGKCYLGKELAKSSESDSSPLSKGKNQVQKVLDFYIPTEIFKASIEHNFSLPNLTFTYKTGYTFLFLSHILRPPIF
ncbi:hypothetical protein [Chryseobacterium sp. FH1]|uniref:hypothetical protein n=1 Tax=Chryseobacterium sp. FH1 TaxID=1233951 RepID=UPI0004E2FD84|nr:hypothetical protein [Chryseobacterium sp. FH1]KFC24608.1 hypothetical protein IO90_00405 [Chryseobacterium sp. FH1]